VKTLQLTKTPVKAQKGYLSIQISIQKEGGDAGTAHLKDDSGSSCSEEEAIED
jgi:vacuolar-type H+-ATPase subunit I/STV1